MIRFLFTYLFSLLQGNYVSGGAVPILQLE